MTTPTHDISAPKRVPFVRSIVAAGPDYSAADFRMELRAAPGATGDAIVSLSRQGAGGQGISAQYDPAFIYAVGQTTPATIYVVQIDESTLEGLGIADPSDAPLELWYDLHVTPLSGAKFIQLQGRFLVYPGVTI